MFTLQMPGSTNATCVIYRLRDYVISRVIFARFIISSRKTNVHSVNSSLLRRAYIRNVHMREKRFKCQLCSYECFYKKNHKNHTRSNKCPFCMLQFNCTKQKRSHIESHIYECEECSKTVDLGKISKHCKALCKEPAKRTIDHNLLKIRVKSIFTDDKGLLVANIPGFPFQANCSLSSAKNNIEKRQFKLYSPVFLIQHQELLQNGSTAILMLNFDLKWMTSCTEVIEWTRDKDGKILPKPRFNRQDLEFKKDEMNVPIGKLFQPWQRGHARAAGNCWIEDDFLASFSSLNYWPQHKDFNMIHWKGLEDHLRTKARRYKKVYITSGAIFTDKDLRVSIKFDDRALIPHSFYKVAFFEQDDGTFKFSCWLMENSDKHQPYTKCLVSLPTLEDCTGKLFLNHEILKRLDPLSVGRSYK